MPLGVSTIPNALTLCEQVGRHWAASSSLGLTADSFAETFGDASGTDQSGPTTALWACALPERARRAECAASLVPAVAPVADNTTGMRSLGVAVTAHAPTIRRAMDLIEDLVAVLWPDGVPAARVPDPPAILGQRLEGIIGPPDLVSLTPTATPAAAPLWRVIDPVITQNPLELFSGAAPSGSGGGGGGASDDGDAVATIVLGFLVVPVTLCGPRRAFDLRYAGDPLEVGRGTARITGTLGQPGTDLVLTSNDPIGTTTIPLASVATVADLRAAITSADPDWTIPYTNAAADDRAATDTLAMTETEAHAAAVRVGITPNAPEE